MPGGGSGVDSVPHGHRPLGQDIGDRRIARDVARHRQGWRGGPRSDTTDAGPCTRIPPRRGVRHSSRVHGPPPIR